ncbi:MAG: hypothetical protein U0572_10190 [Phycisphaerales bacterium]
MRSRHRRHVQWSRFVAALIALATALAGATWPTVRVPGDRFPCEDCGCGCGSAAECWTNCCCHTAHERLAWARANGITPPAWATELLAAQASAEASAQGACCCEHERPATAVDPSTCKAKSKIQVGASSVMLFAAAPATTPPEATHVAMATVADIGCPDPPSLAIDPPPPRS